MTLELETGLPGRHEGALVLPWSRDGSAYGQLVVPVVALVGAPGPTLLIAAGVHGDEYEGQIVLPELARVLDPRQLRGRLLLVPRANPLASRAGRRTSPQDGGNLARLFPGGPGITGALASAIGAALLPLADAVLDLHAGGGSLDYQPCAWGRLPADRALAERTLAMLEAFGAPSVAVMVRPAGGGTLVGAALEASRPAMAVELGGGGAVSADTLALARAGCRRIIAHVGLTDSLPGAVSPRLLAVEPRHFVRAPAAGLFEPLHALGKIVAAGDLAGWLHDPDRLDVAPRPLFFEAAGLVLCRRVPAACEAGDVLMHLGEPTTREALLRGAVT